MASRRGAPEEKPLLATPDVPAGPSDTSPAVPSHIITKLLAFSAALFFLPIASYFLTRDVVFKGNAAYAGGFAALVANVVLVGYIVVAFLDDKKEQEVLDAETKKER
ncbi:hypothetical protein BDY17DRAFT_298775 [Neohortaea acidophila]|uniref:Uncharacterized protein n=1 Tax=Neohortaea acidophila TaxID=245834 RepID=A0A6A6PRH5_9PEZI|nr:uncharacterized protein BDY17DRAFT_298775 [Neohortaea acidophila]KAF2482592.1 hypothetical protein BDY17DRAFT_298775 [Neohortaea acidophila]